ncbi:MAG: outer membrane beta-barrel protein [Adhaeribacter sp.]
MKVLFSFIFFLSLYFSAMAQEQGAGEAPAESFYIGLGVSSTSYMAHYKSNSFPLGGNFTPLPTLHVGYKPNSRISAQIGISYGTHNYTNRNSAIQVDGQILNTHYHIHTRGFALPLTFRYKLSNPAKRLQAYATASLVPTLSSTTQENTEIQGDTQTTTYAGKNSGINGFITGGLGATYRVGNRLEFFGEAILLNRRLIGLGFSTRADNVSFGLGANFKIK